MLLYQAEPALFYTRKDLVTWLLMQTGLHEWLLMNKAGWLMADLLFYSMPLAYLATIKRQPRFGPVVGLLMLLVNWLYVQCYTLYPTNSIEGHVAWLLFPLLLLTKNETTFLLLYDGLRYMFLYFFVSAGVWKIAQGGLFNPAQMNGVLLFQHNHLLTNSPGYWQTELVRYLLRHQWVSYGLYLAATAIELLFFVGFFTKKYDHLILVLFVIFLLADYIIMRIPYFEIAALALPLVLRHDDRQGYPGPEGKSPEKAVPLPGNR